MACSMLFLFCEQGALVGVARGRGVGAEADHGECRGQFALAVFGVGCALAFALAGVFQHRVLGGQALLRFEGLGGLALGEMEGFERGNGLVLVGVGGGVAQRLGPVAGKDGGVLFRAGLGGGDDDAILACAETRWSRRSSWSC